MSNFCSRIIDFLCLKRGIAALLAMAILVGTGEKMAERFLPIYLLALGGGAISIGLLNGMDNLLGALYSFPGGYLSDKLGYKKALLIFNLVAMAGYTVVILVPTWQAVILGSILFISWTALSLPATMSMVSAVLPKNRRTMGVTMHSLVRRIPMALGPVIGGLLIAWYGEKEGVRTAFVAALVLGFASLVLQRVFIREEKQNSSKAVGSPLRMFSFMSKELQNLLISDILIRFCEQIPYAFVVVWVMKSNGLGSVQFALLTTIEMATAVLTYLPVAYLADKTTKKPFVVITFVNFTVFPLFLLISHSFPVLLVAFIIRGLKEFGEPTRKALIMDLAPEDMKAGMFGLYYLLRDVVVSFAAFGGAFLWQVSPSTNFVTAAAFGAAGTIYFAIFGRDLATVAQPIRKPQPEKA
jgi:MFS family permease